MRDRQVTAAMSATTHSFIDEAPQKRARIEIIPLIDVIFFLLATFVLFTLALNQTGGLRVALPAAQTSQPRDNRDAVTLSITADGVVAWDKETITLEAFIARLKALKQVDSDARVFINGDEKARFLQVRYVVDEVRKAGIARISIETRIRNETQN